MEQVEKAEFSSWRTMSQSETDHLPCDWVLELEIEDALPSCYYLAPPEAFTRILAKFPPC